MSAARLARAPLLAALVLSTGLPLLLLALWSVAREWFWPLLLPPAASGDAWALAAGGPIGRAAVTSGLLAAAVGLAGAAIALPVGRLLDRLTGWRRWAGAAAAFLPVAAPPIALGTGLQYFFLVLGLGGTAPGVALAHLVPAVGFLSLYFMGVFALHDRRAEDEARTLGATPRQVMLRVVLPGLRRQALEAASLGFLVSWSQVALTLLVGGGVVRTLPLELFAYLRAGQDRYAAVGALLMVVPPLLALGAARLASGRTSVAVA